MVEAWGGLPDHRFAERKVTVCDDFWSLVRAGRLRAVPELQGFEWPAPPGGQAEGRRGPCSAVFKDGTRLDRVEVVVFATGYTGDHTLLLGSGRENGDPLLDWGRPRDGRRQLYVLGYDSSRYGFGPIACLEAHTVVHCICAEACASDPCPCSCSGVEETAARRQREPRDAGPGAVARVLGRGPPRGLGALYKTEDEDPFAQYSRLLRLQVALRGECSLRGAKEGQETGFSCRRLLLASTHGGLFTGVFAAAASLAAAAGLSLCLASTGDGMVSLL